MKERIINGIIDREGGYVDDPDDSGGETNYGVTKAVARARGYRGSMRIMPRELAYTIYKQNYWDRVKADDLLQLSPDLTEEVVDTAVNMGTSAAAKFLQRSLNAFNNREKYYTDITVDGGIGDQTLVALNEYLKVRKDKVLVKLINCMQGSYYLELTERRPKDGSFLYGWIDKRIDF